MSFSAKSSENFQVLIHNKQGTMITYHLFLKDKQTNTANPMFFLTLIGFSRK